MMRVIRRLMPALFMSLLVCSSFAQPDPGPDKKDKPYKILTSGKQVTVKGTRTISHIMVWTSRGNRVVEQKEINSNSFTFKIPVDDKFYFMMIGFEGGKIYTEKIGTR